MSVAESAERSGGSHLRILVGLAAGILLGLAAHSLQGPDGKPGEIVTTAISIAEPIGRFFLRLMQMVVLPLVFSALFLAVVDVGDLRRLGRIGLTTLFFTGLLSISAVLIGVGLVNLIKPGRAISQETQSG
jgi:DAACS family dicarboxylate/amino acid:cation (Na+ or H+) symporter